MKDKNELTEEELNKVNGGEMLADLHNIDKDIDKDNESAK